jgi:hypothetical protein
MLKDTEDFKDFRFILLFFISLLILAVFPLPYKLYGIIKFFISLPSIILGVYQILNNKFNLEGYILLCIGILYNPILKFSFYREDWIYINLISIFLYLMVLIISYLRLKNK